MKEYWPLEVSEENRVYTFLSCGPSGNIDMTIQFTPTEENGIFNLAFGILDRGGKMDDVIINNNGDRNKIIATVIAAINEFTYHYPGKLAYFSGHTKERNKLYKGALSIYLEQWLQGYTIWALKEDNSFELFKKNTSYFGYIIKEKTKIWYFYNL